MKAIFDFFKKLVGINTEKQQEPTKPEIVIEKISEPAEPIIEVEVEQKVQKIVFISPGVTTQESDVSEKKVSKKTKVPVKKAVTKKQTIKKKK